MKKIDLSKILRKIAQDADELESAPGINPAPQSNQVNPSVSKSYRNFNSGSISIKEMQKAILNFAARAEQSSTSNMQGQGKQEDDNGNYLGGTDPFGNFLTSTYVNSSNPIGKQYLNTDVSGEKNRENASLDNSSFKGIIDSIKRIGAPGSFGTEKSADGIWKNRTNTALKNIYAVINGVVSAAQDMHLDHTLPDNYKKNLEALKSLIPNQYTDVSDAEKTELAKKITPLINACADIFDSFKNTVLNNKNLKKYIEQEKSFVQYKQKQESGSDTLEGVDVQAYKQNIYAPVPNVKVNNLPITLSDLNSIESFKKMMKRVGLNPDDNNLMQSTLNNIKNALGNTNQVTAG